MSGSTTRRVVVGGVALAALAGPAPARQAERWVGYEQRLRLRLRDAADGYFDEVMGPALQTETNRFRFEQNLPPLVWHDDLAAAACAHAADMAQRGFFAHQTPEGFAVGARVGLLARRLVAQVGENLAYRFDPSDVQTARQFMEMWRVSPGHRTNLLRRGFTHVGYGVVRHGGHARAVGAFAAVDAQLPAPLPFSVPDRMTIERLLVGTRPRLASYGFSEPGIAHTEGVVKLGETRSRPPSGVSQLRPLRQTAAHRFQALWGPIFLV